MAKKRSAALFDVISRGKPIAPTARPSGVAWLSPSGDTSDFAPALQVREVPPPSSRSLEPLEYETIAPPAPNSRGQKRVISFNLSYTAAVITAFAGVTVVAGAYLMGRGVDLAQRPFLASTTSSQLRAGPPQRNLLDLRPAVVDRSQLIERNEPATVSPSGQTASPKPGATAAPRDRARKAELNYVIIQGYPEERMAQQAMAALLKQGIDCTIEKKIAGWRTPANWYSVVGTDGFTRITGSSQYDAYIRKVKLVSEQFARKGSFSAFDPRPIKWGGKKD